MPCAAGLVSCAARVIRGPDATFSPKDVLKQRYYNSKEMRSPAPVKNTFIHINLHHLEASNEASVCNVCGGTGAISDGHPNVCPSCHGSGLIIGPDSAEVSATHRSRSQSLPCCLRAKVVDELVSEFYNHSSNESNNEVECSTDKCSWTECSLSDALGDVGPDDMSTPRALHPTVSFERVCTPSPLDDDADFGSHDFGHSTLPPSTVIQPTSSAESPPLATSIQPASSSEAPLATSMQDVVTALSASMSAVPCTFKVQSLAHFSWQMGRISCIRWTVDARKLRGGDTVAVSPLFHLSGEWLNGPVPFKLAISPQGASFRAAHGQGTLQLKCEESQHDCNSLPMTFWLSAGSGRGDTHLSTPSGPIQHNFAQNGTCVLRRRIWDFKSLIDSSTQTFVVFLAVLSPWQCCC